MPIVIAAMTISFFIFATGALVGIVRTENSKTNSLCTQLYSQTQEYQQCITKSIDEVIESVPCIK